MTGTVSVIIPTYNRAALVARAVASALAQALPGDEVVVVDDGSTDGTESVLAPVRGRIVYRRVPNGGAGRARNAGLDAARGDYVAFLDSDDEWLPGKLDYQRGLLDARPEIVFSFHDMRGVYPSGEVVPSLRRRYAGGDLPPGFLGAPVPYSSLAPLPPGLPDAPVRVGDLYPVQLEGESAQIGTVMLRRSAAADGGLRFPTDMRVSEDAEFVARLARRGPAAYIDAELESFHQHHGARLTDLGTEAFVEARLRLLERVWGADAEFMASRGDRVAAARRRLELQRVRILLGEGRARDARAALDRVPGAPAFYRALCWVPGPLMRAAVRLKYPVRR